MTSARRLHRLRLPVALVLISSLLPPELTAQVTEVAPQSGTIGSGFGGAGVTGMTPGGSIANPSLKLDVNGPGKLSVGAGPQIQRGPAIGGADALVNSQTQVGLNAPPGLRLVPGVGGTVDHRAPSEPVRYQGELGAAGERGAARYGPGAEAKDVHLRIQNIGGDIRQAQKAADRGDSAAIESTLSRFYEDQRQRAAASMESMGAAARSALPDPKGVTPEHAVRRTAEVAGGVDAADAPSFYRLALDMAYKNLPEAQAEAQSRDIFSRVVRRASDALIGRKGAEGDGGGLIRQVLTEAVGGSLSRARQEKMLDAIDFYNAHLKLAGKPHVANVEGVKAASRRAAEVAKASGGARLASPRVAFEETAGPSGRAALKAVITAPEAFSDVARLPEAAGAFALSPAALEALGMADAAPFSSAFRLEPDGLAGLKAAYRARLAAGDGPLQGALMALGRWVSGEASRLWARVLAALRALLVKLGLSAARGAPGLSVSADAAREAELSSLLGRSSGAPAVLGNGSELRAVRAEAAPKAAADAFAAFVARAREHAEAERAAALGGKRAAPAASLPPAAAKANAMVQVRRGERTAALAYLDLFEGEPVKDGRVASPALEAFVRSLEPSQPMPSGSVIVRGLALAASLRYGSDRALLFADLSSPDAGGTLRVSVEAAGEGQTARARGYFVARILYNLGFAVALEGGAVQGLVDLDRQALSSAEMADALARLSAVLQALPQVEAALPGMLKDALGQEDASRRIDAFARSLVAERTDAWEKSPVPAAVGAFSAAGESVGAASEVSAPVTYDLAKARAGGFILVTPYAEDAAGFDGMKGVVFTAGGKSSRTAEAARRAGIPAFFAGAAQWTRSSGLRLVSGGRSLLLREGTRVRLGAGALEVAPAR